MKKICKFLCSLLVISMLINFSPMLTGENNGIILTASAESISKPNFSANTGDGCVTLTWKPVNNADKYYVYCFMEDEKIESKSTKETSIVIDNLKNETEYKFLVCTVKDGKKSKYTDYDWIYATPSKNSITKLDSPIISVSQSTSKAYTVNVKWRKVANATSYAVYYKKSGDKKYTKAGTTTKSSFPVELGTLNSGQYKFAVKALYKNNNGEIISASSKVKSINVKDIELTPEEFSSLMNAVFQSDNFTNQYGSIQIVCDENTTKYMPFDVWIKVNCTSSMLDLIDYQSSIKLSKKEKDQIIKKNVALQYYIYYYAEKFMPKKKIMCGLYTGGYKYPNLKLDWQSYQAFTWVNYSCPAYSLNYNDAKYTGKMKWSTETDDFDLPLTQAMIDKAAEDY